MPKLLVDQQASVSRTSFFQAGEESCFDAPQDFLLK